MFRDRWLVPRQLAANRPQSIRAKIGAWRAAMSRKHVSREKFFCCQNPDSESVRLARNRTFRCSASLLAARAPICRVTENALAKAFAAFLQAKRRSFLGIFSIDARTSDRRLDRRATRALGVSRQYFLKREAVFFSALVYSGCSASRFPSARSD